jgi:pantetheine-phosphate adenylyltransferase
MHPSSRVHRIAILGGTFDHFHKGHEALLQKAAQTAEYLLIGLTTDEMGQRSKEHLISTYEEREKSLATYLKEQGVKRFSIFPITDPYGPAITLKDIDMIVVSEETEVRAKEINVKRRKKGLKPLKIVAIRQVLAEDGRPISSARILKKEIDRNGALMGESM